MTAARLIATDLDGTLLRPDGTLSARTLAALLGCARAGIEVVFVTARPPRVTRHLVGQAACAMTAICVNGAMLYDFAADAGTYVHEFTPAVARRIVDELRPLLPDAGYALETGEQVWFGSAYRVGLVGARARFLAEPWDLVWGKVERAVKVLARSPSRSADEMLAAVSGRLSIPAEVSHSGGRGLLEISPAGATKASTLAWLCERRGIGAAEVVAFGDMPNDLPMLRWAGTSYAMANAHPQVLAQVGRVTLSNERDGVAVVLESLLE